MSVLEVRGLHVWFDVPGGARLHAVRGVDFKVEPRERLGLVGESGCGKSTVLLAIMGLLPSNATLAGQVLVDGENIVARGDESARPHRWKDVAMVFQGNMNAFNPVQPIGAQITEPMELHGTASGAVGSARAAELLEMVGLDAATRGRYPHELSGGMRQRAALAMALACEPRVLLADEPTTALDVVVQAQILDLFRRLAEEVGLALVLVTHDLAVVGQVCHRAVTMYAGEIVEAGPVEALHQAPAHPYSALLWAATPTVRRRDGLATVGGKLSSEAAERRRAVRGPTLTTWDNRPASGEPVLRIDGLVVEYPRARTIAEVARRTGESALRAVDGLSLSVAAGEMLALVGQSGCGKTTTALAALRMIDPRSGCVQLEGRDITTLSPRRLRPLRRRMQMVYQDPYESLDPRFRVRDTVAEPLLVHGVGETRAERDDRVREALVRVDLSPAELYLDRYPHQLSGGQRQRLAIATSLVLGPRLLIADEPVSMLDVSVRAGILLLLDDLLRRDDMAVLMITHDLSTAAHFATRIAVMQHGRIVEEGPADEVVSRPRHPYTRKLIEAVPNRSAAGR